MFWTRKVWRFREAFRDFIHESLRHGKIFRWYRWWKAPPRSVETSPHRWQPSDFTSSLGRARAVAGSISEGTRPVGGCWRSQVEWTGLLLLPLSVRCAREYPPVFTTVPSTSTRTVANLHDLFWESAKPTSSESFTSWSWYSRVIAGRWKRQKKNLVFCSPDQFLLECRWFIKSRPGIR